MLDLPRVALPAVVVPLERTGGTVTTSTAKRLRER